MNIRSITLFTDPGWPLRDETLAQAANFIAAAREAFQQDGYTVQTARLATPSFAQRWPLDAVDAAIAHAQALETAAGLAGFEYVAIGPALPGIPQSYAVLPEILAATHTLFASGVIASVTEGISLPAVRACAAIIARLATHNPNGFGNLYFAALANTPAGTPFFPAAYHDDGPPAFALAIEAADLAVTACEAAHSLAEAQQNLTAALEAHADRLAAVCRDLGRRFPHVNRFHGLDYSLAPFPSIPRSLGTAFERLGVPAVGRHGSLAAASFLMDALDRARFPRAGFSGLMLPVLEDSTLAARAAEGTLTVKDLLLFSAVCGSGLDTVPLPGEASPEQIAAVLLDVAALALRLDKPLTARLMPIPGKKAGDPTGFDFEFFANSRVMALEAAPLQGLLAGSETFTIGTRKPPER